jgi:CheY-like chemotaxis protein
LESGADDYLTKPFHLKELLLRVNGMLKRKSWYRQSETLKVTLKVGKCRVDFSDLTIRCDKRTLRLTHQEAELLHYFVEHKGRIISRRELLENVWHLHAQIDTRTVDNFVAGCANILNPSLPGRSILSACAGQAICITRRIEAAQMKIQTAVTAKQKKAFIDFPYRFYCSDPLWIPPLRSEQKKLFDPGKNSLLQHGEHVLFLAADGGNAIGRAAAFIDDGYNRHWNEKVGFFGSFEAVDDVQVAEYLLDACADMAAQARDDPHARSDQLRVAELGCGHR